MKRTPEYTSRLDAFASDIIRGHADRRQLGFRNEIETYLLKTLPDGVKCSPIALCKSVETLSYSSFNALLRGELDNLPFAQFSSEIVEKYYQQMYGYQDRTIYTFAVAEWISGCRTRLTKRQIEMWEKDRNPETQRLSNLHAKGARACIKEGSIKVDDHFKQGVYTLYKLDSGIFQLLQPGIQQLKTYDGTWDEPSAKSYASDEIHLDRIFVNVPYQTTP